MTEIYLDNSATTAGSRSRRPKRCMKCWFTVMAIPPRCTARDWKRRTGSRRQGSRWQIFWTATRHRSPLPPAEPEANNLALLGVAEARVRKGKRIVTTAFEHSSVVRPPTGWNSWAGRSSG